MLYLATQFAWFLVVAFAIGLVMGWLAAETDRPDLLSRGVGYGLGLWLLVGALSWSGLVDGLPAFWIETALLFTAAYFVGCAVAGFVRATTGRVVPAQAAAGEGRRSIHRRRTGRGRTASDRAATRRTDRWRACRREAAGLASGAQRHTRRLETDQGHRRSERGEAKRARHLHFDQIGAWTPANSEWAGSYLAFPGRIEREDWVGQAKLLAAGGETPHSRKLKRAKV